MPDEVVYVKLDDVIEIIKEEHDVCNAGSIKGELNFLKSKVRCCVNGERRVDVRRSIELKLHHEEGTFLHLLESQDIYDFVDETSIEDVELAHYVEKWCEWLNYFFLNDATVNGNLEESRLRGWINGYNYAKHVDEQEYDDRYILVMKKYVITIHKPKKDVIFHYEKIY